MRSLISVAVLAGVFGPLAGPVFAADLDEPLPPPPSPYEEPHPVPPAFVPGPVPPVYYRGPRLYPRPVIYPRPYPAYGPPPVVRAYGGPGPYADEGYDRPYPREPRPYGEPGFRPGPPRQAEIDRRERESFGDDRRDRGDPRYGHYLSREDIERRAERERGPEPDRYADRAPLRDDDR